MEGELQGRSINDIIPDRHHAKHNQHVKDYANYPVSKSMGERGMELVALMKDGTEFNLRVGLHPRAIAGKRYVIATPVKINGK